MKQLVLFLFVVATMCSCRKYNIEHIGCKDDPFQKDGIGLPNIFTPNSDGANDILKLRYDSAITISNFSATVRNLSGIKISESSDPDYIWASLNSNGKSVLENIFICEFCFDANGKHYHEKKKVVLYYGGGSHFRSYSNICIEHFDNCSFSSQWNGSFFDNSLPNNEFINCN